MRRLLLVSVLLGGAWAAAGGPRALRKLAPNASKSTVGSAAPAVPVPTTATGAATSVSYTTMTLNGTANPNGAATTGWFRIHTSNPGTCSDSGGTRVPSSSGDSLGAGSAAVAFDEAVTGLTAGTTYYVCAFASNAR